MKLFKLLIILLFIGCKEDATVTIIKQWHLAPGQKTLDIKKSKKLPQFENQKDIYELLENQVPKGLTLIGEGCEGEIEEDFNENFNGWTIKELVKQKKNKSYSDIMAPVWMKIKAKYGKRVNVSCGDNLSDIERNKLAMSDLRGFVGFYERLKSSKDRPEIFEKYVKSLIQITKSNIANPIEFARKSALESLKKSKHLIEKRNYSFVKAIKEKVNLNPYVVIGGIHAKHLAELLEREGITYKIVEPKGYSSADNELYDLLEQRLTKTIKQYELIWLEAPQGFSEKSIPLKSFLNSSDLAQPKEWKELKELMEQVNLDSNILLSDYDGDGVRDFTVSTSGNKIIISAEDDDWDNDGIPNLMDESWGDIKFSIGKVTSREISNRFDLKNVNSIDLLKKINARGVTLLSSSSLKHDLLILNVIENTLSYANLTKDKLRFIRLSEAKVKYGKNVYFSFNPASLTIDIYQKALLSHFHEISTKHYPNSSIEELLKGYLLPLLYHSLSHEIVHAMDLPIREMAKSDGWKFETKNIKSKYLKTNRLERKKITSILNNISFKEKSPTQWSKLYKKHGKGFLVEKGLPSFYALQKPSEWVAEKVSMCFLRRIFPNSKTKSGAAGYEALLGINPSSVGEEFCSSYFNKVNDTN